MRTGLLALLFAVPAAAQNPGASGGYAGSEACAGCHAAVYKTYRQTAMGRSMSVPARDLPPASVRSDRLDRNFSVFRDASGVRQSEAQPGVFESSWKLEYAIGSGVNGVTYAVRRGDYLFQAPLSYYSRAAKWDLSPGYEFADYGFSRPIQAGCVVCHSGRPQPVAGTLGRFRNPPFQELAIGCENCHGPGQAHILSRGDKTRIVNPASLAPRLADNICMRCHQGGDARVLQPGKDFADFRPGQWLNDTLALFKAPSREDTDLLEHHSAMESSRCFAASGGRMRCITCHDPHRDRRADAVSWYRARCQQCHSGAGCRLAEAERKPLGNDCAACHMPKREAGLIAHSALTNHRIPRRPDQPPPPSPPGTDLIHLNPPGRTVRQPALTMLRAYGEVMEKRPEYQERYLALLAQLAPASPPDPFLEAALGRKALRESGPDANRLAVAHLSKALELGFAAYTAREDLAEALSREGRLEEAVEVLKRAIELEPYAPALHKSLALRYITLKQYPLARAAMERYVELFPQDEFMRNLLRQVGAR
jgi:hypothetical protein